ncbi:MAG TPA: hypothetical protein VFS56_06320 [Gemmatimonadaceae bacterium]|nr:hypothetical protein [Gemmatimonadaceae bacterium]
MHRRENLPINRKDLREIVPDQPKPLSSRIPCEKHDAVSCNASALLEAPFLIVPMMDCKDGEHDVEGSVPKGKRLRNGAHRWRG